MLTAEILRQCLDYNPETGIFRWRMTAPLRQRIDRRGMVAGGNTGHGYLAIKIMGKLYLAHRLAWFYVHGEWPKNQIDHIDGNKSNNAIANLRDCTAAQNSARRVVKASIAPSRGVFPQGPGFVARIHHGGKRHYLGYFSNLADAKAAYSAKAKEIHGEFAYVEPPFAFDYTTAAITNGALSFGA